LDQQSTESGGARAGQGRLAARLEERHCTRITLAKLLRVARSAKTRLLSPECDINWPRRQLSANLDS